MGDSPGSSSDSDVWTSDESAKHIQRLGQVEQDIVKLMEAASVCMGLLAMAQTDPGTSELPRGPERSAMFVQKAEEYFKALNTIQSGIRASLARVRASKIAVGSLKAPDANAIPQTLGSGAASTGQGQGDDRPGGAGMVGRGALQEARVAGDAWTRLAELVVTLDRGDG